MKTTSIVETSRLTFPGRVAKNNLEKCIKMINNKFFKFEYFLTVFVISKAKANFFKHQCSSSCSNIT